MSTTTKWILAISACAALGCEGTTPPDDARFGEEFEAQVNKGTALYTDHCADCHGADGQGTVQGPALAGLDQGALPLEPRAGSARDTQFKTAADVAAFVASNMPPGNPGGLAVDDYYSILAFALYANGIVLEEELTPALAEMLVIPR